MFLNTQIIKKAWNMKNIAKPTLRVKVQQIPRFSKTAEVRSPCLRIRASDRIRH